MNLKMTWMQMMSPLISHHQAPEYMMLNTWTMMPRTFLMTGGVRLIQRLPMMRMQLALAIPLHIQVVHAQTLIVSLLTHALSHLPCGMQPKHLHPWTHPSQHLQHCDLSRSSPCSEPYQHQPRSNSIHSQHPAKSMNYNILTCSWNPWTLTQMLTFGNALPFLLITSSEPATRRASTSRSKPFDLMGRIPGFTLMLCSSKILIL